MIYISEVAHRERTAMMLDPAPNPFPLLSEKVDDGQRSTSFAEPAASSGIFSATRPPKNLKCRVSSFNGDAFT